MTKEEVVVEIEKTIGAANGRIIELVGGDKIESSIITVSFEDGLAVLSSGGSAIAKIDISEEGALKEAKSSIWKTVDGLKPQKPQKDARTLKEIVKEVIEKANSTLREIVSGGFPFSYEEVILTSSEDSAGIYVSSGRTPVCSVARAGGQAGAIREIKEEVWRVVEATRTAVERRGSLKAEADALASDCEKREKAIAALDAAGLSSDMIEGFDKEAARAVVEAVRKAVHKANLGLLLRFEDACDAVGDGDAKLHVRGFSGGLVVLAGGKPCLISRFPRVANNKAVERMIAFLKADIAALAESRAWYLEKVQKEAERAQRLHEIAARIDAADAQLKAMMA